MRSMDRWRVRSPRVADSWHALRWPAAVGAWLVVGSIALAGLVSAADPGSRHLRVTRELSGTVTVVNGDASAFCLDIDVTGVQFCSDAYQRVGAAPLVVGEHVTGTVALLSTGPSSAVEVFILTDPSPTP
jgi:hypothetical protein